MSGQRAQHVQRRHLISVVTFVLVAAGALFLSLVYLGHVGLSSRQIYYADFAYAAGLEAGAPIKVSGIRVGKLAGLHLLVPAQMPKPAAPVPQMGQQAVPVVRATLLLQDEVQAFVTHGSRISVVTTGIIGDAYLELSPGQGALWPKDRAMRGVDAPHLQHLALASETLLRHLVPLFEPAAAPLGAAQDNAAAPAARFLAAITKLLASHEQDVDTLLHQGADAVADARDVMAALHTAVGDGVLLKQTVSNTATLIHEVQRNYPALRAQTDTALAQLSALLEDADARMRGASLQALLADAASAAGHLASAAATVDHLACAVGNGEGSLGGAFRDRTLYDNLAALVHDIRQHPYKLLWRK